MDIPASKAQQEQIDRLCERIGQVTDAPDAILDQFRRFPRHRFLARLYLIDEKTGRYRREPLAVTAACEDPKALQAIYADAALPVQMRNGDCLSSTSQPSLMAGMMMDAGVRRGARVLEIGTATGWNAALLSGVVGESGKVVTVEVDPELAAAARERLAAHGCEQVEVVCGDGYLGAPEHGPFDSILVTVACPHLAPPWVEQLADGGTLLAPVSLPDHSSPMVALHGGPRPQGRFTGWTWFVPVQGGSWQAWPPPLLARRTSWFAAALAEPAGREPWPWTGDQPMMSNSLGLFLAASRLPGFATFEMPDHPTRDRLRLGLGQHDPPGLAVIDGDAMLYHGDGAPARRLWKLVERYVEMGTPGLGDWNVRWAAEAKHQLGPPSAPGLGLELGGTFGSHTAKTV